MTQNIYVAFIGNVNKMAHIATFLPQLLKPLDLVALTSIFYVLSIPTASYISGFVMQEY